MFAAFLLLGWGGAASFSQVVISPQAQSGNPAAKNDPTRPETQPPLDTDRDPIPSPDIDVSPTTTALPPAASVPATSIAASRTGNSTANQSAPNQATGIEKQQNGVYVLHANVDEVLLNCAVIDAKGQPVMALSRDDFRVWEDGVPETVNSVQHMDLPVSMGILIDDSGSMRDKRATVNAAAYHLLNASNLEDEAFVVNFSDRPYLDQGFTTDRVALSRGLSRFDPAGTTALYDAVAASADELAKYGKNRKQVLLIITDGADNASRLSLQEAIRRVQGLAGPVVYSIGLLFDDEPRESQQAKDDLERLSQETGGVAYFARSLDDVYSIAAEVARDIREQYVVDYHSSKPFTQGGYRSVRVEASTPRQGPMVVRTKRGYYPRMEQKTAEQQTQPLQNAQQ
ncbi:MAG: VWA domain-containing protein [Terracidiphilus sp.]|jgi:VWFA-related protein